MTTSDQFKAWVVAQTGEKQFERRIETRSLADLPAGEVVVAVHYSSLNYKDALSAIGNRGVTRNYPHTPGIDAAGVVMESSDSVFKPGDPVIVTSYDLGMNTPGGFGEVIRVPAGWVVPLPEGLTLREAMVYGTAGFTAALAVWRLTEHGTRPGDGEILVSGATGGVGSMAVSILSKLGYSVTAVNGRKDATDYLTSIGAGTVISREEATDTSGRPLLKSRWAGVIDNVGGEILATAVKSTALHAPVTSSGNVASPDLPLTVFPFILRGVTLIGIDSQNCPMPIRRRIWEKIATEWKIPRLDRVATMAGFGEISDAIDRILAGERLGRTVFEIRPS